MRRVWKFLGLASVIGVAATGAVIAREERKRAAYTPDEVRARLRDRVTDDPPAETITSGA